MDQRDIETARRQAEKYLLAAGIVITPAERESLEVVGLGLGKFEKLGAVILVYINTGRYCAKELLLLPDQIIPEHRHPPVNTDPGKQETFRCRWGEFYLYVPGEPTPNPRAAIPQEKKRYFTVWHEIILRPGDQYTVPPNTLHWFQAGEKGAVISEFSSTSRDELDLFTDPEIQRFLD